MGKPTHKRDHRGHFVKAAIPQAVRREVALRAGGIPGQTVPAACTYCGAPGRIYWPNLHSGRPGSWVNFHDLELDHVIPEFKGGPSTADNIVLACRPCNRGKGHR